MTLQEIRNEVASRLEEAGIESAAYETWVFLEWKLGISRADYYMDSAKEVSEEEWKTLSEVISQRTRRVPLQYLMKSCDFMGYDFYVDERVLIPRHDTECLVEEAVSYLKDLAFLKKIRKDVTPIRVLDLCTGSGCIGISIKLLVEEAQVVLSDLSEDALAVAAYNKEKFNKEKLNADVKVLQGDLFESLLTLPEEERRYDLIVSNPPYIPTKVVEGLMPEVRDHEPHMALDGTEDGLAFYRRITKESPSYLKKGGWLMYEIGAEQGEDVSALMKNSGFDDVSVLGDLAGLDRIVKGRLS